LRDRWLAVPLLWRHIEHLPARREYLMRVPGASNSALSDSDDWWPIAGQRDVYCRLASAKVSVKVVDGTRFFGLYIRACP
jgi:hypothetical protein